MRTRRVEFAKIQQTTLDQKKQEAEAELQRKKREAHEKAEAEVQRKQREAHEKLAKEKLDREAEVRRKKREKLKRKTNK